MSSAKRVCIVGGGPAGLSAAIELRRQGVADVVVHEREPVAGGIPRHTDHLGYGLHDLHRLLTGPRYAQRLVVAAREAGVRLQTDSPVFDIDRLDADAVVLATGARERPRAARLVPGDRPAGVYTTGTVQQLTALHHLDVGRRAVVVGAEHVSFSAILSLRHGGCRTVAMVTPLPRHQSYRVLRLATASRYRVPLHTGVDIAEVIGRRRVQAVMLTDGTRIECDTVVFTGDWIADHELARHAGLPLNGARSPMVDHGFHTPRHGVFAVGNLVHPAETAGVCALDGRRVVAGVLRHLGGAPWPATATIDCVPPLLWATPAANGMTVRTSEFGVGRIVARDATGAVVHRGRRRSLVPNRAIHLPDVDAATVAVEA